MCSLCNTSGDIEHISSVILCITFKNSSITLVLMSSAGQQIFSEVKTMHNYLLLFLQARGGHFILDLVFDELYVVFVFLCQMFCNNIFGPGLSFVDF